MTCHHPSNKQASKAARLLFKLLLIKKKRKSKPVSPLVDAQVKKMVSPELLNVLNRKEYISTSFTELTIRRSCVPHHRESMSVANHYHETLFRTDALLSRWLNVPPGSVFDAAKAKEAA